MGRLSGSRGPRPGCRLGRTSRDGASRNPPEESAGRDLRQITVGLGGRAVVEVDLAGARPDDEAVAALLATLRTFTDVPDVLNARKLIELRELGRGGGRPVRRTRVRRLRDRSTRGPRLTFEATRGMH